MAAPPIITFEPPVSGTAGGQIVSLFGNALDSVTAVSFGVQPALVFSAYLVSGHPTYNSRIDAVAPPGEGDCGHQRQRPKWLDKYRAGEFHVGRSDDCRGGEQRLSS